MNTIQQLQNQNIDIRPLVPADIDSLVQLFPLDQREKLRTQWNAYYTQQTDGHRYTCIITKNGRVVGYGSLLAESEYTLFEQNDVLEICDIWIAPAERKQGLATLLITYFESIAQDEEAAHTGMSIGLTADWSAAHNLCIRLGYLPDGNGMTYKGIPVVKGTQYPVDDALRLWFVKDLTAQEDE
jgi:ribosomal protein S18 acetylase RimI-like enzyme